MSGEKKISTQAVQGLTEGYHGPFYNPFKLPPSYYEEMAQTWNQRMDETFEERLRLCTYRINPVLIEPLGQEMGDLKKRASTHAARQFRRALELARIEDEKMKKRKACPIAPSIFFDPDSFFTEDPYEARRVVKKQRLNCENY